MFGGKNREKLLYIQNVEYFFIKMVNICNFLSFLFFKIFDIVLVLDSDVLKKQVHACILSRFSHVSEGWHALLQGTFPTPGSNLCLLCLLHW